MSSIILYCRSGFESDCAAEIQFHAEQLGYYGFAKAGDGKGFVEFSCFQSEHSVSLYQSIDFRELVFARHWFLALAEMQLDEANRVASILALEQKLPRCGSLRLEYPDTNDGKALSSFCKKFTRPLENALVKHQWLTKKNNPKLPAMQLFFVSGTHCWLGYSDTRNGNAQPNGILRLKFPSEAPSRSTLKLDEAFMVLLNEQEREQYIENGQHAVDLGACPGGWTYQLVRRNMFVAAVDNGPMAQSLMDTGQVQHYREDGFKYKPERDNVSWLVCDMVERPAKVSRLMLKWLANGWCRYAMFNLKLPMKQRFTEVNQDLELLREGLSELGFKHEVRAKQLYHDREEITVFARVY
ncbi:MULTISPECIES: 23S rRNA (cytidine(2498)-2'-O)-methyltransferase RlmM [unclassified Agarivorans]|uniref:23S rRNA (cytidine(2498)-2'-O)-methyltransferase RlmM n=1 Tax=unclassified Agarivorans TaxID=2636026 RepID=UPI0026E176CD|nr:MULTISPECIES: 23S rRNA (cytidine(2498)-2'-O)-methyltransferase RlmM [unclassified Agarivorans]MDO6687346.1 23S rRNA (cytidine(2498)-2'-O)-methyltransferase RlmM [Agarivorans sp. 3_MG-2023]MDO6717004.1 23S rRNA (cytidine(2498)-2'-O)-methyltransferase RlmM [Agarivorans sp. 2_MG-2023]